MVAGKMLRCDAHLPEKEQKKVGGKGTKNKATHAAPKGSIAWAFCARQLHLGARHSGT